MEKPAGMLKIDDGYYFGLGVFETIAVEENRPVFLREHLDRLLTGMKTLGFIQEEKPDLKREQLKKRVEDKLLAHPISRGALKLMVSRENVLLEKRENHYTKEQYKTGFTADFSGIRRNSTSPFTYLKSFNYGDCILEKRKAKGLGIDEPIFLNERGEISEGAVSNLFFVRKNGEIVTPRISCGLLPGVVRRVLLEQGIGKETVIHPGELTEFTEAFLTNSLMGVMPLRKLAEISFRERKITQDIMKVYGELKAEGKTQEER